MNKTVRYDITDLISNKQVFHLFEFHIWVTTCILKKNCTFNISTFKRKKSNVNFMY